MNDCYVGATYSFKRGDIAAYAHSPGKPMKVMPEPYSWQEGLN